MKRILLFSLSVLLLASCVSKKKFNEMKQGRETAEASLSQVTKKFNDCEDEKKDLTSKLATVEGNLKKAMDDLAKAKENEKAMMEQLEYLKRTNTTLLANLEDLSVVSRASAESIKKSLDQLEGQGKYIRDLTTSMARKDSLNLALVMNLKRSLKDMNDEDINIEVRKGVVYISISDKMLFRSGSAVITRQAEAVLEKIANVLNDHKDLDILVEGHTDNVPISTDCLADNWDLSVKRATSVVRTLQNRHKVAPERMTAGGRSEFIPVSDNATSAGRSKNRRTDIIILPKLDQFFDLFGTKS
jgi:chemotaxis protein MotB